MFFAEHLHLRSTSDTSHLWRKRKKIIRFRSHPQRDRELFPHLLLRHHFSSLCFCFLGEVVLINRNQSLPVVGTDPETCLRTTAATRSPVDALPCLLNERYFCKFIDSKYIRLAFTYARIRRNSVREAFKSFLFLEQTIIINLIASDEQWMGRQATSGEDPSVRNPQPI